MKKLLLSIMATLVSVFGYAGDVVYKTLTFPGGNSGEISSYTDTWTATCEDLTWTIVNFNNNKNAWDYIKCGRKNTASTGFISTPLISEKITKVVVTVDACTASKVTESYLEVASDEEFTNDVQKVEATIATGDVVYKVPTVKENQYYRLTFVCDAGSSNGLITISKVELYKYDASTISTPTFSVKGGNLYEETQVAITADEGSDIYYSSDNTTYQKYESPLSITASCTLYAYAQAGETKSEVVQESYVMAKSFTSLEELFKETPTKEGVPVVVPITNEPIMGFYGSGYRNGVYLDYYPRESENRFELYCKDVPATWKESDLLSGIAKGIYQDYNGTIEISLISWDGFRAEAVKPVGPTITPATGTYDTDQTVTIVDPTGNDYTIYYTLDGSEPTESSAIYEAPFTVSETTTVKAVYVDDDDNMSAVSTAVITINKQAVYTTIAELIKNCTTSGSNNAPVVTLRTANLLVTGVNGSNVFVSDETGAFLLYGSNSGLTKGDIISGSVEGKLYSYNGLPEISVSDKWASVTLMSQGNAVTATKVAAADITAADANKYVRLEGLEYKSEETVSNKTNFTLTDGTTDVVIRDNFSNLTDVFKAGEKYNVNVFVIPFKETIQYYVVSTDDVESVSGAAEDVNGDGIIDTQDVLAVYDAIQASSNDSRYDVNGDTIIDTQDVLAIYEKIRKQ